MRSKQSERCEIGNDFWDAGPGRLQQCACCVLSASKPWKKEDDRFEGCVVFDRSYSAPFTFSSFRFLYIWILFFSVSKFYFCFCFFFPLKKLIFQCPIYFEQGEACYLSKKKKKKERPVVDGSVLWPSV